MMTKEQAATAASNWWRRVMKRGGWDNGDAKSHVTHSLMTAGVDRPDDAAIDRVADAIREHLLTLANPMDWGLYSDYGCSTVDDLAKSLGVGYNTLLLGPVKSGTQVKAAYDVASTGDWTIVAADGYGSNWHAIDEDGNPIDPDPVGE